MPPERSLILIVTASLIAVTSVLVPEGEVEEVSVWRRTKTEIGARVQWPGPNVFELYLDDATWPAAEVIAQLFDQMQDVLADSEMTWGEARPPCLPGHAHPRNLARTGTGLEWSCPARGTRWPAFHDTFQGLEE